MRIELTQCVLRPWAAGDEPSLVHHANNRGIWLNLRDRFPHPYTPEAAAAWIAHATSFDPINHFAIDIGGEAVGGVGLTPQQDVERISAEIGYWIGEEFWGKGIMTEAVRGCTRYAWETLGFTRVYAAVFAWNPASMRVLEKAGYQREGRLRRSSIKDGQVVDTVLYAAVRE